MVDPNTRQGGCACSAVRYEISDDPLFVHACYCTDCQRRSGAAFGLTMVLVENQLRLVKGEPLSHDQVADSGKIKTQFFCPECGTMLWGRSGSRPGAVSLFPGTLDDTSWFRPAAHIWTRSKQAWVSFADSAPAFETVYDPAVIWPKASLARLRARQTAEDDR